MATLLSQRIQLPPLAVFGSVRVLGHARRHVRSPRPSELFAVIHSVAITGSTRHE